jgi:hypothetical protein
MAKNLGLLGFFFCLLAVATAAGCGSKSKDITDTDAAACPSGFTECGSDCVNTDVDRNHCGTCDNPCDPGEICDGAGNCALSCQAGFVVCDSICIDPLTDRQHCGAGADCATEPGEACDPGEICDGAGNCAGSCQAGLVECGGTCIDPLTNRQYCGAGADCTADPGEACDPGEICDGAGNCALSCQAGLVDCGGTCLRRRGQLRAFVPGGPYELRRDLHRPAHRPAILRGGRRLLGGPGRNV